ncbi:MAG TPA: hypothetical protein VLY86_03510 [Methanothrix sp.]|nr:hypothetical protein [Methanothrix sp.]
MRTKKAQGLFQKCSFQAIMIAIPVLLIAVTVSFLSGAGSAADATLKDDAYHYMHSGIDDKLYNEWWSFNGISNETQFLVRYFIRDPENVTGLRKLQVLAVFLEDGKPPLTGRQESQGFGGDRDGPNVDIDQSGISSQDGSSFQVWGAVNDALTGEPVQWNLQYVPAISPWFATPVQAHVGHLKGDWMKWLVYIPSGKVTGTLTLGNRTLDITAVGYHDHNWGRWAFNDPQWNWAEVSDPVKGFSLTLGDSLGEERNTMLGVMYGGNLIKFTGKQIKLTYTDFAFDQTTARIYPRGYRVQADNGDYQLDLTIKSEKNVPLLVSYPPPEPSHVIFEQVSRFQGFLRTRTSVLYRFDEKGFSEYTTHRLHPIFGKVTAGSSTNVAWAKNTSVNITAANATEAEVIVANATVANTTMVKSNVANKTAANKTVANATPLNKKVVNAIASSKTVANTFAGNETDANITTINTTTVKFTVTATNERTSQVKTAEISTDGWFSVDANYVDYLADSKAPWVSTGDRLRLDVMDESGRSKSTEILVDLSKDSQEKDLRL